MSQENMIAFIAKVQSDIDLLAKMNAVTDADGAIAIAKSAGFEITAGDVIRQQARIASELSDDELENVAGGSVTMLKAAGIFTALIATAYAIAITVSLEGDKKQSIDFYQLALVKIAL